MAATATLRIDGSVTGAPEGGFTIGPLYITSAAANYQSQVITLQSGDNTITVPSSPAPSCCIIQLPAANTVVTKFIGVTGNTGTELGKTGCMVIPLNTASLPASILINAASNHAAPTQIIFF